MNSELEALVLELAEAKAEENAAKEARIQLEERIMGLVGNDQTEGSKSISNDEGTIKVTVTNKVTRSCDFEVLNEIDEMLAEDLQLVDFKPSLNLSNYRTVYKVANVETRAKIDNAVTIKPAKSSVTIKIG